MAPGNCRLQVNETIKQEGEQEMATSNNHKLLVPIDGSDRSVRTAKYLAEMPAFFNMEINLYNVFISIPESYYDLGKEPASVKITSGLYAWEKQQRSQIEKQMQKCRKVLLSSDYNPAKIRTTIQKRRVGVARDIITESKNGYSAVVSRRRGMSNLQGLIMGSVALKLLNGIDSVPLIFAGRKPNNRRLLIAVDGSDNAMRAVDFVGKMLGGFDYTIGLVTVLRAEEHQIIDNSIDEVFQQYLAEMEPQIGQSLNQARQRLVSAGFAESEVGIEIIKGAKSRAGAIVDAAERGNFDTIVVGRRGLSRVQQFFTGRVSTKVLQVGRKHHVWIIN
jgi:nucleotide-binding universal stress UspA family protein